MNFKDFENRFWNKKMFIKQMDNPLKMSGWLLSLTT